MPDSIITPADRIIGRSLLIAESVMSELRHRLLALPYFGYLTQEQLLQAARNIITEYEGLQVESLANADLAAWIAGYDQVARKLPTWAIDQFSPFWRRPPNKPPKLPPLITSPAGDEPDDVRFPLIERAAESLFRRQILQPDEFNRRSAAAKAKAFTVARESREDVLGRIRDKLAETAREGASLPEFKERLGEDLQKSFIGPGHLELVYRQNLQQALADGHDSLASNPIVDEIFPFQEYLAIHDARARLEHKALETYGLEGTAIYWKSDPFWRYFRPPWAFGCRCGVNLLTIEAAARRGLKLASEWLRTGRPPLVRESMLDRIPFRPKPGFMRVAA